MPHVQKGTMSLILPPRLDDRAAADEAMMLSIPIYEEEVGGSLRPTWLPVDPSTYVPPPPRRSRRANRVTFAKAAKFTALLAVTWVLAFTSVVGSHFVRDYVAKRSLAAALSANATSSDPIAAANDGASSSARSSDPTSVAAAHAEKAVDSGVSLTVDVNDLPVSKDFPRNRKNHGAGSRRAAGS